MKSFLILLLSFFQLSSTLDIVNESCQKVPEELESTCNYPNFLKVVSSSNQEIIDSTSCNKECKKTDWKEEPKVIFDQAEAGKYYTLLCVDPNPPGYEAGQYFLHWLVSGIRGEDFFKGDLSHAKHLTGYYGPNPPPQSGKHHYMFLAFEETENDIKLEAPKSRGKFSLVSWLQNHPKLCGPVSGVQFKTQY